MAREILLLYLRVRWLLLRRGLNATVVHVRDAGASAPRLSEGKVGPHPGQLALATIRILRLLPADDHRIMGSLVLTGLLARRGLASTLVIGVDSGPDFAVRFWVEHGGAPLLDPGAFHRFLEFE
jgi:transglutaminase superfamily protein